MRHFVVSRFLPACLAFLRSVPALRCPGRVRVGVAGEGLIVHSYGYLYEGMLANLLRV